MILRAESGAQFSDAAASTRAEKLPQAILSKTFASGLVATEADAAQTEGRTYEAAEMLDGIRSECPVRAPVRRPDRRADRCQSSVGAHSAQNQL